jgi:hypothetical protein
LPYSTKKATLAGSTQKEARKGSVSAPPAVTMMASLRLCRMVRLKEAQKKMRPRGSTFCHSSRGALGSSSSTDCSTGTCGGVRAWCG